MSSEDDLVGLVRAALSGAGTIREVKMFGGIGFMLDGNMIAAPSKRGLLVRVGKDGQRDALKRPGARPMEMRGRIMEGYIYVDPPGLSATPVKTWMQLALLTLLSLRRSLSGGRLARFGRRLSRRPGGGEGDGFAVPAAAPRGHPAVPDADGQSWSSRMARRESGSDREGQNQSISEACSQESPSLGSSTLNPVAAGRSWSLRMPFRSGRRSRPRGRVRPCGSSAIASPLNSVRRRGWPGA